jgi:hypothetical protein
MNSRLECRKVTWVATATLLGVLGLVLPYYGCERDDGFTAPPVDNAPELRRPGHRMRPIREVYPSESHAPDRD